MSHCALRHLSESNWPFGFHCGVILRSRRCYDTCIYSHIFTHHFFETTGTPGFNMPEYRLLEKTWKGTWRVQCKSKPERRRGIEYLTVPTYRHDERSSLRIGDCCFVVWGLQLPDRPEAVGGLLYHLASNLLLRLHIDDPVNAFPEPLLNNFALIHADWVC